VQRHGAVDGRWLKAALLAVVILLCVGCVAALRGDASRGDQWPTYGNDPGGTRYSPLGQIDRSNVVRLQVAWTYRTGESGGAPAYAHIAFEATPILVEGTLFVSTPYNRVIALDAETGVERWVYEPKVDRTRRLAIVTSRGVSTWLDPAAAPGTACRRRIYVATIDARLIAVDAASGTPCAGFGRGGEVDLTQGIVVRDGPCCYQVTSPPAIVDGLVVVGSSIADNRSADMERGVVRAYDARTGAQAWAWDPIPRTGEDPMFREWKSEQAARVGAANAWSILSYDAERDLVFVPTSSPSPDYFGGERLGSNRYANSVVALRAKTGQVVWHFQTVHHDLWDYDVPAQPVLAEMVRGGARVPVVVQAVKTGFVFVLHRETGEPMWPVEERPVPQTDVPGEQTWPTQPFPTLPPPLVPQRLRAEDAWGVTPWDRGKCREQIEALRNDGIFTPPSLRGSLTLPGNAGGTNWGSVAVDPARRLVVQNQSNLAFVVRLIPQDRYEEEKKAGKGPIGVREFAPQTGAPYALMRQPLQSPIQLPCSPPPWGTLAAWSLDDGRIRWQVPFGTVPDKIPVPLPTVFGLPNLGGPLVTAGGLVFIGAAMDGYFRAYDVETGAELWNDRLPAGGNATPMTYTANGKQFVLIAAGGHGKLGTRRGDWVVAYALP
jgi:quinoprotein glucose dehydrogenase